MKRYDGFEAIGRTRIHSINTPCIIYNLDSIGKKIEAIQTAFMGNSYAQFYPLKANPCYEIVRYCLQKGLGIDACSMGDIEVAELSGTSPGQISFTGVGLTEQDMRLLWAKRITPNLGSVDEIKRWAQLFPNSEIGIRVCASMPESISDNQYSLKMGIFPGEWAQIKRIISKNHLRIIRLHRHESGNSPDACALLASFSSSFSVLPLWIWENIKSVNFGGGWGASYLQGADLDIELLVKGMRDIVQKYEPQWRCNGITIEVEPGEYLISECGLIVSKVIGARVIKLNDPANEIQTIILNTPFPLTSGSRKPELLYAVDFESATPPGKKKIYPSIIYGRSNSGMDTVNKKTFLPSVKTGETAVIYGVGAYAPVLLSHFNELDIPAEYILDNGQIFCIKKTLTFSDYYMRSYYSHRSGS